MTERTSPDPPNWGVTGNSKRQLANFAAEGKAQLAKTLISRSGFDLMTDIYTREKSGWIAPTYETYRLATAELFRLMKCVAATKDAVELLEHAARSLPEDMDIFNIRPEVPSGFLFVGRPMTSGKEQIAAYVWWTLPHPATLIVGTLTPDARLAMTNWEICSGRTLLNADEDLVNAPTQESKDDAITDLRIIVAFNLLLAQKVVETEEAKPTRQMRRQAARHHTPLDPVVIVELPVRHHAHSSGGGVAVDWSHRWIVSGHWRKQWYATDKVHRPKWIAPHVKGPDDKPLIVKEKRYVFDPPNKETT